MKIYNTLTRKKEEFKPIKKGKVGLYVCGPTVYDEPHIGHARSAYVFDVITRYLRYRGFRVKFVRNITDIDDKIIARARGERTEGEPIDKAAAKITKKYLKRYEEDMAFLGIEKPDKEPRATETIPDMIKFINILIKKGFAYEKSGNVYFSVRKFKPYGRLSGQSLDEMEEGARVSVDKEKRDPLDFALWKTAKEDEPAYKSPWGPGRPGWHIECSVMSTKFLGKDFLIHGGGLDLVFPHHENEIAQTEASGKKSACFWMHNGLLTINGQKMSKSLGNFISIREFSKSPDLLKLLFLSSHYRHPVDYTDEKIQEMAKAKERIVIFLEKLKTKNAKGKTKTKNAKLIDLKNQFIKAMDDDFNTPKALSVIFDLVSMGNTCFDKGEKKSALEIKKAVKDFCSLLGLSLKRPRIADENFKKRIEELIEDRNAARSNKDFKKADEIRSRLLKQNIILEDTKEGTEWRKKL